MSDSRACTFPGCNGVGKFANSRCMRHRYRVVPKEGHRVAKVVRHVPGSSYADNTHKMDISLPAEPWGAE